MISKEKFMEIKRLKEAGVPTAVIARRIGVSVPIVAKWARMDEAGFDALRRNDIPYMDQYREFIISILRVCPQTRETNILYRLKEEFPEFDVSLRSAVSITFSLLNPWMLQTLGNSASNHQSPSSQGFYGCQSCG